MNQERILSRLSALSPALEHNWAQLSLIEDSLRGTIRAVQSFLGDLTTLAGEHNQVLGVKWDIPDTDDYLVECIVAGASARGELPAVQVCADILVLSEMCLPSLYEIVSARWTFDPQSACLRGVDRRVAAQLKCAGFAVEAGSGDNTELSFSISFSSHRPKARIQIRIKTAAASITAMAVGASGGFEKPLRAHVEVIRALGGRLDESVAALLRSRSELEQDPTLSQRLELLLAAVTRFEEVANKGSTPLDPALADAITSVKRLSIPDPGLERLLSSSGLLPGQSSTVSPLFTSDAPLRLGDRGHVPDQLSRSDFDDGTKQEVFPQDFEVEEGAATLDFLRNGMSDNDADPGSNSDSVPVSRPGEEPVVGGNLDSGKEDLSPEESAKARLIAREHPWTVNLSAGVSSAKSAPSKEKPAGNKPEVTVNIGGVKPDTPVQHEQDMYATVLVNIEDLKKKSSDTKK